MVISCQTTHIANSLRLSNKPVSEPLPLQTLCLSFLGSYAILANAMLIQECLKAKTPIND